MLRKILRRIDVTAFPLASSETNERLGIVDGKLSKTFEDFDEYASTLSEIKVACHGEKFHTLNYKSSGSEGFELFGDYMSKEPAYRIEWSIVR